jgi:serine/threonine protein kinase
VLMYEMLTVKPPFSQAEHKYNFGNVALPEGLSADCCDLVSRLLKVNPEERLSARQALEHNWIKQFKKNSLLFQRRQLKTMEQELEKVFEEE